MNTFGTLFIVATPIGNLQDITLRALETLRTCDMVIAEDTRHTRKLLASHDIPTPLTSMHAHSSDTKIHKLVELLEQGKNLALVVDAGTPTISDPGGVLVQALHAKAPHVPVVPIPGASALTAMLSIARKPIHQFQFLGFPPHKKGRKKFFEHIQNATLPSVIYESVHRIHKTLEALREQAPECTIEIGRELTKQFETHYIGTPEELVRHFHEHPEELRGEFVLIINTSK